MQPNIRSEIHSNWDHLRSDNFSSENNGAENLAENYSGHSDDQVEHKKSMFFWFFVAAASLLLIAALYGAYQYYSQSNTISNEKINLNLNIEDNVKGGQEGRLTTSILNNNKVAMLDTTLTVKIQKGMSRDGVIDQDIKIYKLGDVLQNIYTATDTEYIFNGQEGDKRKISAILEYKVLGSNSTFKKELIKEVKIISPSVTINIKALKEVIENNEYLLKLKVKNVSYTSNVSLVLKVDVPAGFAIKKESADNPAQVEIKNLKIGEEREYNVSGFFKSSLSASKTFVASVSTYENQNIKSLISESSQEVFLVGSPIAYDFKLKVSNVEKKSFESNLQNVLEMSFENVSENYISDFVVTATQGSKKYNFDKNDDTEFEKINPQEKRKLIMDIGKDVQTPNTNIKFELFGKVRGGENSILLKKFELNIPTI